MEKIPRVGDKVYHNGWKFIVCEVEISTNPITGLRIVNTKQVVAP